MLSVAVSQCTTMSSLTRKDGIPDEDSTVCKLLLPKNQNGVKCKQHVSMDCNLWCLRCQIPVCDDCMENEHDEHPVKHLRKYLVHRIEQKLGRNICDGLTSYLEVLEGAIEQQERMLTTMENRVITTESFLTEARRKREAVSRYFENISNLGTKESDKIEDSLLLELSEMEFSLQDAISDRSVSVQVEFQTNNAASQTDIFAEQSGILSVSISKEDNERGDSCNRVENETPNSATKVTKTLYFPFNWDLSLVKLPQSNQLDTFRVELYISEEFCKEHEHFARYGALRRCLRVKRVWNPDAEKSQYHHLDRCKATLLPGFDPSHRDWFYIDDDNYCLAAFRVGNGPTVDIELCLEYHI